MKRGIQRVYPVTASKAKHRTCIFTFWHRSVPTTLPLLALYIAFLVELNEKQASKMVISGVCVGESAVVTIKGRNDFTVRKSTRPLIPWKQEANTIVQNGRSKLSSIRSSASAPCIVQFANRSEVPLKVNWLNFEGNKVLYTTLATGSMYHQRTFTAHPWVLEGESGDFYAIYVGAPPLLQK